MKTVIIDGYDVSDELISFEEDRSSQDELDLEPVSQSVRLKMSNLNGRVGKILGVVYNSVPAPTSDSNGDVVTFYEDNLVVIKNDNGKVLFRGFVVQDSVENPEIDTDEPDEEFTVSFQCISVLGHVLEKMADQHIDTTFFKGLLTTVNISKIPDQYDEKQMGSVFEGRVDTYEKHKEWGVTGSSFGFWTSGALYTGVEKFFIECFKRYLSITDRGDGQPPLSFDFPTGEFNDIVRERWMSISILAKAVYSDPNSDDDELVYFRDKLDEILGWDAVNQERNPPNPPREPKNKSYAIADIALDLLKLHNCRYIYNPVDNKITVVSILEGSTVFSETSVNVKEIPSFKTLKNYLSPTNVSRFSFVNIVYPPLHAGHESNDFIVPGMISTSKVNGEAVSVPVESAIYLKAQTKRPVDLRPAIFGKLTTFEAQCFVRHQTLEDTGGLSKWGPFNCQIVSNKETFNLSSGVDTSLGRQKMYESRIDEFYVLRNNYYASCSISSVEIYPGQILIINGKKFQIINCQPDYDTDKSELLIMYRGDLNGD